MRLDRRELRCKQALASRVVSLDRSCIRNRPQAYLIPGPSVTRCGGKSRARREADGVLGSRRKIPGWRRLGPAGPNLGAPDGGSPLCRCSPCGSRVRGLREFFWLPSPASSSPLRSAWSPSVSAPCPCPSYRPCLPSRISLREFCRIGPLQGPAQQKTHLGARPLCALRASHLTYQHTPGAARRYVSEVS